MACGEYLEMISAGLDSELEETRELFLMRHLVICGDCRGEYEENLRLKEMLSGGHYTLQAEVPAGFSARLTDLIEMHHLPDERLDPLEGEEELFFDEPLAPKRSGASGSGAFFKWAIAASLVLTVSAVALYDGEETAPLQKQALLDAKELKPRVLKSEHSERPDNRDRELNYYIDRHSETVYSSPAKTANRGGRIVYATFNPITRRAY